MPFNVVESFKSFSAFMYIDQKLHFAWILRRAFHKVSVHFKLKLVKNKSTVVFTVCSSQAELLNRGTISSGGRLSCASEDV